MKAYYKLFTTVINGETYTDSSAMYLSEEKAETEEKIITWENLDNFYYDYGCFLPFNIWHFKKGRRISFFDGSIFNKKTWDIVERKTPNFSFTFKIETKEYDEKYLSINKILDYQDAEKAIKYLNERGLKVF